MSWPCLCPREVKALKQNQFSLVQPLPHNFPSADVSTHVRSYWKSLIYRVWATAAAYMSLLKLRSATLNSLSALMGMLLAAGSGISWSMASSLIISVWLVAAGSGALNSYLDRDIDKVMHRTSRRPLPFGRIKPAEKALYTGMLLVSAGLIISSVWLSWLATLFIALGAVIYIFVYTMWLKRKTPWGIVIGGLAGSCALLAGWASVTASFSLSPLLFSVFIFLWTPGHFWGLAIRTKDDCERANLPTLPTIYGERVASKWAALSNIVLLPLSTIPYILGMLGEPYLFISLVGGLIVLAVNIKLYLTPTPQNAWTAFKLSSPYLAIVYLAVAVDIFLR